jgi:hypothetical protein
MTTGIKDFAIFVMGTKYICDSYFFTILYNHPLPYQHITILDILVSFDKVIYVRGRCRPLLDAVLPFLCFNIGVPSFLVLSLLQFPRPPLPF